MTELSQTARPSSSSTTPRAWRSVLKDCRERDGFKVVGVARSEWTFAAIDLYHPAVVVLDNRMRGAATGLALLPVMRQRRPRLPIAMMTAFGGRSMADEARRGRASAYFDKPFRVADLGGEIRPQIGEPS